MEETLTKHGPDPFGASEEGGAPVLEPRLVLAWSLEEPQRVGEILTPMGSSADGSHVFGRESGTALGGREVEAQLCLAQARPPRLALTGPPEAPRVSRRQLRVRPRGDGQLMVENVGRCPLLVNGQEVTQALVSPGDVLELKSQLIFLCEERPLQLRALSPGSDYGVFPFGHADPYGIVGEGPEAWALRRRILFLAKADAHLLIVGPSGSGKELAAQAIHQLSHRGERRLVSRNAVTVPEGLMDAELFGNAQGYPNPAMAERPGLIGAAHRSTLLLDELGELTPELQAHLLRVMDSGEYQRLGSAQVRKSDLRLMGLTNRSESELKHDLLARLKLRLEVPGLEARRGDIPLIARHLLRRMARDIPELATRFFKTSRPSGEPRLSPALVTHLLRMDYPTNVRQLESALYESVEHSEGPFILPGPSLKSRAGAPPRRKRRDSARSAPSLKPGPARSEGEVSIDDIRDAIQRLGTGREAAKELGITYRQLHYLLQREGLSIRALTLEGGS